MSIKRKWFHACMFVSVGLFAACNGEEDEYVYPSLLTEMAELHTDENGSGRMLLTDGGEMYAVNNVMEGLYPLVSYRVVCSYLPLLQDNGTYALADVYSIKSVSMLLPDTLNLENEPLKVVSVWAGGGYLNLRLDLKTQSGRHYLTFREDSITETSSGKLLNLTLVHNRGENLQYYTETVYASLRPGNYWSLQPGDSIALNILTDDGFRIWKVAY